MKNYFRIGLFAFFPALLLLSGCIKDECKGKRTYVQYTPIYKTADEIRNGVKTEAARPLKNPGKIYYYDHYLFVNEVSEGIHIFDNSDPASPQNLAFIAIPGNMDMAVKDNILYADSYIDLLTFNLNNPAQPSLDRRLESVFDIYYFDSNIGYLVDYKKENITVDLDCYDPNFNNGWFWKGTGEFFWATDNSVSPSAAGGGGGGSQAPSVGTGGSMARFAINDNFLYIVDAASLKTFNVSNAATPTNVNTVQMGWNIETIFPYGNHLFIGSQSGMYIFDASNPAAPVQQSVFAHARVCDPVFVSGNKAYVTLRDGTTCQGFENQMDVVDISDLNNPVLLKTYPMKHPFGLSIRDNILFLCDDGLKVFDIADWQTIDQHLLTHDFGIDAYDVISLPNQVLMLIGKTGLYQYDTSDPNNLKRLSVIEVQKN